MCACVRVCACVRACVCVCVIKAVHSFVCGGGGVIQGNRYMS